MPQPDSHELIGLIKRLAALVHQQVDALLKPHDLARTQYVVLRHLRERGGLATSELVAKLQVEPATLSGIVDALEAKGLVRRVERSDDKRRKDVQLTEAGRTLLANIPPPAPVVERTMLYGVNDYDAMRIRDVMEHMVDNLETELRKQEGV